MKRVFEAMVYVAACGAAACAVDPLDMPSPPDLGALVAAYQNPTAAFDSQVARNLAADFSERLKRLDSFDGIDKLWSDVIDPTVAAAGAPADQTTETRRGPFGLQDQGYAEVRHQCRDAAGEESGTLELRLTFHNATVDSVLWGDGQKCSLVAREKALLLDGKVSADHHARVLLFDGILQKGDVQLVNGSVDLRRVEQGFETLVPVGARFLVLRAGKEEFGVRAKNGDWRCTIASGACARAQ